MVPLVIIDTAREHGAKQELLLILVVALLVLRVTHRVGRSPVLLETVDTPASAVQCISEVLTGRSRDAEPSPPGTH